MVYRCYSVRVVAVVVVAGGGGRGRGGGRGGRGGGGVAEVAHSRTSRGYPPRGGRERRPWQPNGAALAAAGTEGHQKQERAARRSIARQAIPRVRGV